MATAQKPSQSDRKATGGATAPAGPQAQVQAPGSARTRILRGAAEVFGRHGFGASSVEAILAAAGVSRRTFYRHFRSKDEVLGVLFDRSVSLLLDAVRVSDARGSAADRLDAAVEAYLRIHAESGALARVLLQEQLSADSSLARQREAAMRAFTNLISRSITRGGRPAPDPILVHGVVAGVNQITVQMASEHPEGRFDVPRAKAAVLRLLRALD